MHEYFCCCCIVALVRALVAKTNFGWFKFLRLLLKAVMGKRFMTITVIRVPQTIITFHYENGGYIITWIMKENTHIHRCTCTCTHKAWQPTATTCVSIPANRSHHHHHHHRPPTFQIFFGHNFCLCRRHFWFFFLSSLPALILSLLAFLCVGTYSQLTPLMSLFVST